MTKGLRDMKSLWDAFMSLMYIPIDILGFKICFMDMFIFFFMLSICITLLKFAIGLFGNTGGSGIGGA